MTPEQLDEVTRDLRCLTCPNETIADSAAPMALDVKRYVVEHLGQGESKRQIIDALTARYGEALRYQPVVASHTSLLWAMPALCMLAGAMILRRLLMKRRAA